LVVHVGIGVVVEAIAADLYARQQAFSLVQKFKVGHYNRSMLKVMKILVMLHALVGGAAVLSACGQRGPLVLPTTPASAGRATLPQTLNPLHSPPKASPSAPAPSGQATTPQSIPAATPR
jgi:predicted small lipoprotein YifL